MKKNTTKNIIEKIYEYTLEDIMGERFARYAKYIIQDRAIPDVRDGLKPVQRRILYSMFKEKNTYDKPYRKSAKTVGDVIGNYHPHGDTSIYEAMVRMSQDWKMSHPYIDMHGNNGSIDGDSPAAYRYTEARLSKISQELLKDIDKNTVKFAPNFDDSILEPTVLPAKYPNLLVSGTTGISAGYATNIPPHNLGEIVDATIKRIDSPNCRLETIMDIVKGPDFPTGGIACGIDGIKQAFETGRGKVIVKSKASIIKEKNKQQIIISEIPFDVLKVNIVRKIDEIRIDKKIDGIIEVRDESDREGLRIVVDVKKDVDANLILNFIYKNTDAQTTYNYNMVAIVNRRPMTLGILQILDAYIAHQKEVILKRTKFDLETAKKRLHIVEGLIKALSILDEVIKTIRASKNKSDAKDNLVAKYAFTEIQAEAIVVLQLYKLTNTDVTLLEEELSNLRKIVLGLEKILSDEEALKQVMKDELRYIKKEYAISRKTVIEEEVVEIKIDSKDLINKEDVIVLLTKDGYIKRTSKRSYNKDEEPLLKEQDYILGLYELNTLDTLLIFTNLGNYLYVPVHEIPDIKWKQLGKHISNLVKTDENEQVISCIPVIDFNKDIDITIATKNGMIKRTHLEDFKVSRYTKPITCINLKNSDEVINACYTKYQDVLLATHCSYALWFDVSDIPLSGLKSSGVKSVSLKNDYIVSLINFDKNQEYVSVFTTNNTAKRVRLEEFEKSSRARRGLLLLREVKTNPYKILKVFIENNKTYFGLKTTSDIKEVKTTDLPIQDRYKTGSTISKENVIDVFIVTNLVTKEEINDIKQEVITPILEKEVSHQISLKEIDERLQEIDEIL